MAGYLRLQDRRNCGRFNPGALLLSAGQCGMMLWRRPASASPSDSGVVLTRNGIFAAHLGKELGGGRARPPRFRVFIAPADALDSLLIVGAFPFKIRGQRLIKRVGNALPIPLGIVVQLRSPFRSDWYCVHVPRVRAEPPCAKECGGARHAPGHVPGDPHRTARNAENRPESQISRFPSTMKTNPQTQSVNQIPASPVLCSQRVSRRS